MYALIGIGTNGVEIPLLVFFSWQDAFNHLAKYFVISQEFHVLTYLDGRYSKKYQTDKTYFVDQQRQMELDMKALKESGDFVSVEAKSFTRDRNFFILSDFDAIIDEDENGSDKILHAFFKNGAYSGGRGDCYAIAVRRIEYGEPIVGWDLD